MHDFSTQSDIYTTAYQHIWPRTTEVSHESHHPPWSSTKPCCMFEVNMIYLFTTFTIAYLPLVNMCIQCNREPQLKRKSWPYCVKINGHPGENNKKSLQTFLKPFQNISTRKWWCSSSVELNLDTGSKDFHIVQSF